MDEKEQITSEERLKIAQPFLIASRHARALAEREIKKLVHIEERYKASGIWATDLLADRYGRLEEAIESPRPNIKK